MNSSNNSNLGTINWSDLVKGLILAIITGVGEYIYNILNSGTFNIDFRAVGSLALKIFVCYLIKQILTDRTGEMIITRMLKLIFRK